MGRALVALANGSHHPQGILSPSHGVPLNVVNDGCIPPLAQLSIGCNAASSQIPPWMFFILSSICNYHALRSQVIFSIGLSLLLALKIHPMYMKLFVKLSVYCLSRQIHPRPRWLPQLVPDRLDKWSYGHRYYHIPSLSRKKPRDTKKNASDSIWVERVSGVSQKQVDQSHCASMLVTHFYTNSDRIWRLKRDGDLIFHDRFSSSSIKVRILSELCLNSSRSCLFLSNLGSWSSLPAVSNNLVGCPLGCVRPFSIKLMNSSSISSGVNELVLGLYHLYSQLHIPIIALACSFAFTLRK